MASFLDKHSGAWGGFGQTGELAAVCRGPPREADWINSSLRTSCSLRGHQGNMGWKGKIERLYLALIGLLPVCILDCPICDTTEMILLHSCYFLSNQEQTVTFTCALPSNSINIELHPQTYTPLNFSELKFNPKLIYCIC